ncbi:MAG: radical SAM protein [archaeon]
MSKRVLLVNPPSEFLIDQRVFLPLGLASVAAFSREKGVDVDLLDLAGVKDYRAAVQKKVSQGNFEAVGITSTSPQFYYAHKVLEAIKQTSPSLKVILGGAHGSMFFSLKKSLEARFGREGLEERLREEDPNFASIEDFDTIAYGEERALITALKSDQKWVDGGITSSLDQLPMPARDLFDMQSYLFTKEGQPKFTINRSPTGSLISQRGCPYVCEFCCGRDSVLYNRVSLPGGALRAHSPDWILQELDAMNAEFGLDSFMFYDDEFNLHSEKTISLCERLSERDYHFRGFLRSNLLAKNPEVAKAMKSAGFEEVLVGIETGSDRILANHLSKGTTPEMNYEAARVCLEAGLKFKALTMLGHTSETEADILATRNWLVKAGQMYRDKLGPGKFSFDLTVFQPYAGSKIWDQAVRNTGDFAERYAWVYQTNRGGSVVDPSFGGIYFNKVDFGSEEHGFYKGVPGKYQAFIRTQGITSSRFVELRDSIDAEVRDSLGIKRIT